MRRGAVTCGPSAPQDGATALALAASQAHTDTVELLLDRGADLEAKHEVSEAAVNIAAQQAAPGIAGGPGRGIGDYALRCRVPVAYRRVMRRWRGSTSAGERWYDEVQ